MDDTSIKAEYQKHFLIEIIITIYCFSFQMAFISWKIEQPLRGMDLQEKGEKDKMDIGKLFRKS